MILTFAGSLYWIAPEVIEKNKTSATTDVFSFGICLWELITRTLPYPGLFQAAITYNVVAKQMRPLIPTWCPPFWSSLMIRSWAQDPHTRPSFNQIVTELQTLTGSAFFENGKLPTQRQEFEEVEWTYE